MYSLASPLLSTTDSHANLIATSLRTMMASSTTRGSASGLEGRTSPTTSRSGGKHWLLEQCPKRYEQMRLCRWPVMPGYSLLLRSDAQI